jgi:hypothetical protein
MCFSCGLDQAFARAAWVAALEYAHGVADLSGSPEGKHPHPRISIADENPYKTGTFFTHQQSGFVMERGMQVPTTLHLEVRLQQPVCEKCNVALAVHKMGPLQVRTQCTECGEARSYALPPQANGIVKGICAEISDEHGNDRPLTRIEADAIHCPNCGGHLDVKPGERLANCQFCRTTSRLPSKTQYRGGGARVETETWYVAFEGPSATRKRLERAPDAPLGGEIPETDKKIEDPPKRKAGRPADMLLVIGLPILMVVLVGGIDLLLSVFLDFEIVLPF